MPPHKPFRFKQFSLHHHLCPMPITTDSVLVGACANVVNAKRVLDVGTGCGVIALMIAQRAPEAVIHAIDIHQGAVNQAALNFSLSPWASRLKASQADFCNFAATEGGYNLIVSNPPYHTEATLSPDSHRANARNASSLPLELLIENSRALLAPDGELCIITPYKLRAEIVQLATAADLQVESCLIVKGNPTANPSRTIWHLKRSHSCATRYGHLTIEMARGEYTQQYIALTKDFYLKM